MFLTASKDGASKEGAYKEVLSFVNGWPGGKSGDVSVTASSISCLQLPNFVGDTAKMSPINYFCIFCHAPDHRSLAGEFFDFTSLAFLHLVGSIG